MNDGYVVIKAELNTKSFDAQIEDVEYQLKELDYELSHAKELKLDNRTIKEYEKEAEKLTNKLVGLKKKQQDLNNQNYIQFGKGMENVTRNVTRWGLALFGIRSSYTFIRNMIGQVTSQNNELAQKMEYIRFALSTVIEPIAKFIVDVIYNILAGLGAIIKAITGVNIFAKATAKNFNKANKSAGKLKKTLTGFDEVNILSNNNGSGGGLSNGLIGDFQNKIGDFADKIKTTLEKIIEFIRHGFLDKLRELFGPVGDIIYLPFLLGFTFIESILSKLYEGIRKIVDGIINIFKGNFFEGIKQVFSGIFTIMKAPFTALVIAVDKVWEQIKESTSYWWGKIKDSFKNIANALWEPFENFINLIKGLWDKIATPIKNLVNKIKKALNFKVEMEFSSIGGGSNSYGGGTFGGRAKGGIYYPKLAVGGIINQPGRGIPYHGATIGERGAEAVVPLTDSQQMELLGEAIGRYITVNLTNVTELDGRTIARKVQEVGNNTNFLMNR